MSKENEIKLAVTGEVITAFYDEIKEKLSLGIELDGETAEKISDVIDDAGLVYHGENFPIKQLDDGRLVFKASSRFMPELEGITPEAYQSIGVGSEVTIYCKLKSGTALRKKYVAAYIVGIQMIKFVEFVKESVFGSSDYEAF